jgi:hypothetical protein
MALNLCSTRGLNSSCAGTGVLGVLPASTRVCQLRTLMRSSGSADAPLTPGASQAYALATRIVGVRSTWTAPSYMPARLVRELWHNHTQPVVQINMTGGFVTSMCPNGVSVALFLACSPEDDTGIIVIVMIIGIIRSSRSFITHTLIL